MKRWVKILLVVFVVLVVVVAVGAVSRQIPFQAVQAGSKTYRLAYTLTETDGGKRVGMQHVAMIVVSGRKTVLKQRSRVPLVTGHSPNPVALRRGCSTSI